jgi:hypothetical protein
VPASSVVLVDDAALVALRPPNDANPLEAPMIAYPVNPVPSHLNGCTVVAAFRLPVEPGMRNGCIVVVYCGDNHVASEHSFGDTGWHQGHYGTLDECMTWAAERFAEKAEQAQRRASVETAAKAYDVEPGDRYHGRIGFDD